MPLMGTVDLSYSEATHISTCAECKKRFGRTRHHRYVRTKGDRKLWYCSYTCYRVKAREDEERDKEAFRRECEFLDRRARCNAEYRKRAAEHRAKNIPLEYPILATKEDALKYIEHAKEKLDYYGKQWLASEPGTADRERNYKLLKSWERKIKFAREQAETLPE